MNHLIANKESKITLGLIIISSIGLLTGVFLEDLLLFSVSKAAVVLFIFLLYLINRKRGYLFFGVFLLCMALSQMGLCYSYFFNTTYANLISEIFYVISLVSLFNHLLLNIKLSVLVKKYFVYVLISLVLGFFAFLKLNQTLNYHDGMFKSPWFIFTLTYNIFIILVLVFSFLNYIYNKHKESLLLFVSTSCIVLSEFIKIATYYNNALEVLPVLYSVIFLIGFYFVYKYITKNYYKTLV